MITFTRSTYEKVSGRLLGTSQFLLSLCFIFLLSACGGGGGGTPTSSTGTEPLPIEVSTGGDTSANPAALTLDTVYADSITAVGKSYYKFTTDNREFAYRIDLQELTSNFIINVYSDSGFSNLVDSCYQSTNNDDCETRLFAADTTYYIELQESSVAQDDFTIAIKRIITGEGEMDTPIVLTVGSPYIGTVGPRRLSSRMVSYYKFTTNSADSTYTLSLQGATNDVRWKLYSGYWTGPVRDCDKIWDAGDESCTTVTLTGNTEHHLMVEAEGIEGSLVTINITEGGANSETVTSEGSIANPVLLTLEQAHKGSVANNSSSYYKFQGTNQIASYLVKIEKASTDMELEIYTDSAFTNKVDNGYFPSIFYDHNWYTILLDANTTYYLKLRNTINLEIPDEYLITVLPNVIGDPNSEGTSITPVDLTVGLTHSGSVGSSSTSYYQFTVPEAKPYRISLTGATTDLSWSLEHDWIVDTYTQYCNNNTFTSDDEICDTTFVLNAGSTARLYVSEYNFDVPTTYNLLIETIEGQGEGTYATPIALTNGVTHPGSIDANMSSYYSFTTAADKRNYRISVTGATSDVEWDLNPAPFGLGFGCDRYNAVADEICDTGLLEPDTTYLLIANETDGLNTAIDVLVDTGTAIKNLAFDTPFNDTMDSIDNIIYYKFTTDAINTDYTISIERTTVHNNQFNWELFTDDTYGNSTIYVKTCDITSPVTGYTSCTVTGLSADTTYYLQARRSGTDSTGVTDNYDLTVNASNFSEGPIDSPVTLSTGVLHTGTVPSNGSSYYQFTTAGGGGAIHDIAYDGESESYVKIFDDSLFTNQVAICYAASGSINCNTTNKLSASTTYYVEVEDIGGYTGSFSLTISPQ